MKREIPSGGPWITEKEVAYVTDACRNGWYQNWHNYLDRFEAAMASFTNTKYAIATSSCTGALHIAMAALGIKPGDEVIIPETTWIATASCVCYLGATPVFVDVHRDTWCMDPQCFQAAITSKTKAVIPVHMFGHPADMDEINAIAEKHGVTVIEDAAPGIGSLYHEKPAGSLGFAAAFSFQGAKPFTTGEGGVLVTNDKKFYERAYYYWDHCRDNSGMLNVTGIGLKYKMSNIQAALGLAQVERAQEIINHRRQIFFWYKDRLGDVVGMSMNVEKPGIYNNYYVPTIILDKDFGITRDEVIKRMDDEGIRSRPFFRCISKLPMFKPVKTPVADHLAACGINLPCASKLSEDDISYAAGIIRKILGVS
ncbi:MAG: DegT/DnrJ/EryC1/StrS family aminotransferase [Candidatus Aceula meridiana]|nr:DegT/DnrJ/EryC1/StrS family aminotransferase [Candidatus Aceula meridiana]